MQDSDDVFRLVAPDRNARVLRLQDLLDDPVRRIVGIECLHLGAMDHDVVDAQRAEIEHAAEHVSVMARDRAFLRLQLDGAADFLVRRENVGFVVDPRRSQLQQQCNDRLNDEHRRTKHGDHDLHDRGDRQRQTVGVGDGVGLRQHLREDHHQHRHDHGGIGDADLAEQADEQAGTQRGREDVHQVVAEQDRTDQALRMLEQTVHPARCLVAFRFQGMHARSGRGGQRCLRAGE